MQLTQLLPEVAVLLNDWVAQVRHAARRAVLTLLPFAAPAELLRTLTQVARLQYATRTDHGEWTAAFEQALLARLDTETVAKGVLSHDVRIARACFQLIKKHQLLSIEGLAALGLRVRQDIVMATHSANLATTLPEPARTEMLQLCLKSHFGPVRAIGLRALLATENDVGAHAVAVASLLDAQSTVRATAASYLCGGGVDVAGHYRSVLQSQQSSAKQRRVCLVALAALRTGGDLALVQSFTGDQLPIVRLAAFMAWLKLAPVDKDRIAQLALADAAPGIRKFAVQAIRRDGAYVPFELIRDTLFRIEDIPLLLRCCIAYKWAGLEVIAKLAADFVNDDPARPQLVAALHAWVRHSGEVYEAAKPEQASFLSSASARRSLERLVGDEQGVLGTLRFELSRLGPG